MENSSSDRSSFRAAGQFLSVDRFAVKTDGAEPLRSSSEAGRVTTCRIVAEDISTVLFTGSVDREAQIGAFLIR